MTLARAWLPAFGFSIFLASAASAEIKPADSYVDIGNWRYTPILDTEKGEDPVDGFLGLLNPNVSVGSNITAIWYYRDHAGTWVSKAWVDDDEWKVIESLKINLGVSDEHDADWATWEAKLEGVTPTEQTAALYEKGFLVGDPIGDIAQQSGQFNEIVTFLKLIGHPVAEVDFELDNPEQCEPIYYLNWMKAVFTVAASDNRTEAGMANAISALTCIPSWLIPHWTITITPAPPWGPPLPPPPTIGPGWTPPVNPVRPGLGSPLECRYTATVTQSRQRVRKRWWPGVGEVYCTETQTRTCTYTVGCLHDSGDSSTPCPPQPTCAVTPVLRCTDGPWSSCW